MKRILHPVIFLLAVFLVFEEWLWDTLKAQLRKLSALPAVEAVESLIKRMPPWAALLVMVIPGFILLPFKLAALYLLGHGHPLLGLLALLAAKLTGTALAAYLFDLVRDSARKISWFNTFYVGFVGLFAKAKAWLHVQPSYVWVRGQAVEVKAWVRARTNKESRMLRKLAAAKVLARRDSDAA